MFHPVPPLQSVIKLTTAAIQKYPNEHVFKSLKAVALQRTGKADEAMQVGEAAGSKWAGRLAGNLMQNIACLLARCTPHHIY